MRTRYCSPGNHAHHLNQRFCFRYESLPLFLVTLVSALTLAICLEFVLAKRKKKESLVSAFSAPGFQNSHFTAIFYISSFLFIYCLFSSLLFFSALRLLFSINYSYFNPQEKKNMKKKMAKKVAENRIKKQKQQNIK